MPQRDRILLWSQHWRSSPGLKHCFKQAKPLYGCSGERDVSEGWQQHRPHVTAPTRSRSRLPLSDSSALRAELHNPSSTQIQKQKQSTSNLSLPFLHLCLALCFSTAISPGSPDKPPWEAVPPVPRLFSPNVPTAGILAPDPPLLLPSARKSCEP